jgi:hypothetical protein
MLNRPDLAEVWQADETIGWVYQFFNEQEKADVFERLYQQKQKIRRQDIPAATQLFTPHWIVRFLVQNTLGRLWVQMHPDTRLLGSELLDYLVPLEGEVIPPSRCDHGSVPDGQGPPYWIPPVVRCISDWWPLTCLPRCTRRSWTVLASRVGLKRLGGDPADIAAAIIENNLFGIDIDLRAVQLSRWPSTSRPKA